MGAGLALELMQRYPEVYQADLVASREGLNTLGNISVAGCGDFVVVNCYTQQEIGHGVQASYEAIAESLKKVKQAFPRQRIGLPLLGCGLGGLDEYEVIRIFEEVVPEATLVRFQSRRDLSRT